MLLQLFIYFVCLCKVVQYKLNLKSSYMAYGHQCFVECYVEIRYLHLNDASLFQTALQAGRKNEKSMKVFTQK